MKDPHDIIKRPVLTEKAYEGIEDKRYVFEVDIKANKAEIKSAIEAVFADDGVKVAKVNTVRTIGKMKRQGRTQGMTPETKKAYVILKKDSNGKWALLDGGKNRIPTNTKGCWSNLCASGKVNIQSRNGHYVIFGKQYKAKRSAYDYYCLSKLHKTVRLHSLLYKKGKKFRTHK